MEMCMARISGRTTPGVVAEQALSQASSNAGKNAYRSLDSRHALGEANAVPENRAQMRRRFYRTWLFSLALVVSGCRQPQESKGLTKITLQADWYPQPEHGGFYTALAKGHYQEEGLDVSIPSGGPYLSPYQQVAAGGAQFGMGSSDRILEAVSEG